MDSEAVARKGDKTRYQPGKRPSTFSTYVPSGSSMKFPGMNLMSWLPANEIAVAAFLERRIRFDQIHALNLATLNAYLPAAPHSLADLLAIDAQARATAQQIMTRGLR